MNRLIRTVYRKEMKDMLRDKRAVLAIASYAFGVPLLMAFIFFLMADDRAETARSTVALSGSDQAPGMVAFLEKQGLEVVPVVSLDTPESLPDGADAMVVLPDDFGVKLGRGESVPVQLYVDETSRQQADRGDDVREALDAYGQHVAGVRLVTRGVPLGLMAPIVVNRSDLAPSSFINKMLGNSLMLVFMLAPFVMGMSVALDALAGERERQSLQSLMAQPVSTGNLVAGKWAMVATFAFGGTMLAVTIDLILLQFVPADVLPFKLQLTVGGFILAVLELAALSMFVASVLLAVSIHAKSFKEGQTYMSMMMMAPVIVGYAKMYGENKLPAVTKYLPIFADVESLGRIFFDGSPDLAVTGAAFLSAIVGTAICLWLTSRRLSSEQILSEA
ncbi:ABC transporter permease [Kordiimonas lipolytica]|uniref:ABC transporter permease n=1 Tax=Kordiimonas lipolytica TaxID=1662421 RepID=A0ABV8UCU6_9PROT|nr:ABC transporter permease [Kordiimonas lipolytica]